ncbi:MAG: penicillin acylase family protein [Bryobacteraceae bacterium]
MQSRLVRIINVTLVVVAALIAFAVYWYAVRPLPKTSGQIQAPIGAAAQIERDARGVPHIEAASWQDAIFLQGYVTAQDRLWQMDTMRRLGRGHLAEVFGRKALNADERSRRMRMGALAEAAEARLRPQDRALFAAYARGVNDYIDTHHDDYSLKFSLPGHAYDPRPWRISDSLTIALDMYRDLTDFSHFDFDKGRYFANAINPAKAHVLFPAVEGGFVSPGSNAWAVSGAHTADGKPMLANDPHLDYSIPGIWYLVQLKAPGLDVSGATIPGVPSVILGHNAQIAWGATNLESDAMDLYTEQIDDRTGRYVFQDKPEQARLDRQMIGVRGGNPVQLDTWITRHGPVVAHKNGKSFSMKWTAAYGFGFPFFDIDRAQNWKQFRKALENFWGPAQNFIYADRAGNIGYQAAGKIPIREGFGSGAPLDGSSGKFEWSGYIPFDKLPSIYDPKSGMLATSNQDPFPRDYPYTVDGSYADTYRVNQVRALLAAKKKLTVGDMLAIQKDVYSAFDSFVAHQALAAVAKCGSKNKLVKEAVRVLHGWNGQMGKNQAAPMIAELLYNRMADWLTKSLLKPDAAKRILKEEWPFGGGGQSGTRSARSLAAFTPDIIPRPAVVQKLLETRPQGWVPHNNWDAWLVARLAAALELGRQAQGTPVSHWKWGGLLQWKLVQPVGNSIPFAAQFFNIGPAPMSGSSTTVKQTTTVLGPSERMVADMGSLDNSVQNLVAGESGNVASGHYKDQWPAYYRGTSFPMQFNHIDAKQVLHVRPSPE